ncbi:MAG: hypothetical protein WCG94_03615 [Methanothrix sp.]
MISEFSTVIVGTGEEMEPRHFQDLLVAMSLARDFYAVYAPVIFCFIDVVLDHHYQVDGNWLRQGPGRWPKNSPGCAASESVPHP